jgi:hypothetical protein
MLPAFHDAFSLTSLLFAFWLGMVVGVSAVATPVKFRARGLARSTALEIGKVTFALFGRIEIAFSLLATLCTVGLKASAVPFTVALACLGIVACQNFWILPILADRVDDTSRGGNSPPSAAHRLYAGFEGLKILLLALGIFLPGSAV